MFEHPPHQDSGEQHASRTYLERAPYHRPSLLVRVVTGSSGVVLGGVLAFSVGAYVGSHKPSWFVNAVDTLEDVESSVGVGVRALESQEDSVPAVDEPPAPVLAEPSAACLDKMAAAGSVALGLPEAGNAHGVFVASPAPAIPWEDARNGSISFAYVTATDGKATTEKHFQESWSGLSECGILRGAVHRYRSAKSIEDQARNFIAALSGDMGELPPAIALDGKHRSTRECETYVEGLVTLGQTIEDQLSIPPVILTSAAFWNDTLKCTSDALTEQRARIISSYPLWLREDDGSGEVPGHWHRADFEEEGQKLSLGKSKVDLESYNGDVAQLMRWATGLRN